MKLNANGWVGHPTCHPNSISSPNLINRWHKFFASRILQDTEISIYIDANIELINDPWPLIKTFIDSGKPLGVFIHPERKNIQEEIDACFEKKKLTGSNLLLLDSLLKVYRENGFPFDRQLLTGGVLFRRHDSAVLDNGMSLWWEKTSKYVPRDQITLPYVLWKMNIPYVAFDEDIFNNRYFLRYPHKCRAQSIYKTKNYLKKFLTWNMR